MTKAVVGLGNPGRRYAATRHNAGFWVVDALAASLGTSLEEARCGALWAPARYGEHELVLVKPQTFMNRSGVPVSAFREAYRLDTADILVAHDDLDLGIGRVKLKRGGGTGGHRGLESLAVELDDPGFVRLRVGVGRPPAGEDAADYVLAAPEADAKEHLGRATERAADAVLLWLDLGVEAAMNRVNAPLTDLEGSGPAC